MNPALSHWYPPPPSQDDEDEFYDPFENGADTWNWEIHMCLISMSLYLCLYLGRSSVSSWLNSEPSFDLRGKKMQNTQMSADQNSAMTWWRAQEKDVFFFFLAIRNLILGYWICSLGMGPLLSRRRWMCSLVWCWSSLKAQIKAVLVHLWLRSKIIWPVPEKLMFFAGFIHKSHLLKSGCYFTQFNSFHDSILQSRHYSFEGPLFCCCVINLL